MKLKLSWCNLIYAFVAMGISFAFGIATESVITGVGASLLFCLLKIWSWDFINDDLGCKPIIWRNLRREIAGWVIGALVGGILTYLVLAYKNAHNH